MSDQSLNEFQSELCENMDINDLNLEENDISNHLKSSHILEDSFQELNQSTNEKRIETQNLLQNSLSASLRKEMIIKAKLSPQKQNLLKNFEACDTNLKDQNEDPEFSEKLDVLTYQSSTTCQDLLPIKNSVHLSKKKLFKEPDKDTNDVLAKYLKEVEEEAYKNGSDETVHRYISQPIKELNEKIIHKNIVDEIGKNQRKNLHKVTQKNGKKNSGKNEKYLSKKTSKNLSKKESPKSRKHLKVVQKNEEIKSEVLDSPPIAQMENIRSHLYSIINQENKKDFFLEKTSSTSSHVPDHNNWNNDEMMINITSQMMKMLKQARHQTYHPDEGDLETERSILKDTLEKERCRRKHCEKEIEILQKNVLETQQELAIAKSVEFKKDSMIQQLDKMLLQMLSGWKIHEENLLKNIQKINLEKEEFEVEKESLKKMNRSLENDLARVLEKLEDDKQKLVDAEEDQFEIRRTFQSKALQIQAVIEEKQKDVENLKEERSHLRNDVCVLKKRLKDVSENLDNQSKRFCEEKEELIKSFNEMVEKYQKEVDDFQEKLKHEKLKVEDLNEEIKIKDSKILKDFEEIRKFEIKNSELEEKNSEKLKEMKKIHEIEMNEKIKEEIKKSKKEFEEKEFEIIKYNKKQVLQLIESHKEELFNLHQKYDKEMLKKEKELKKVVDEVEKRYKEKLEKRSSDIREEMKNKVQNLFQTQYDETLQAMGDGKVEVKTPIITRLTSNTKHLMISIPATTETTATETTNNNNTSLTHEMKSDEANYFNLQLDSMINEKSRNILSNLDKKLEELKNSNKSPPSLKIFSNHQHPPSSDLQPQHPSSSDLQHQHPPSSDLQPQHPSSSDLQHQQEIISATLEHSPPTKLPSDNFQLNRKQYLEHCIKKLLHSNSNLSSSNKSSNESGANSSSEIFEQTQITPFEDKAALPKSRIKQQVRFCDDENSNLYQPITTQRFISTNQPPDVAQLLDFYCSKTSFQNNETKQAASNLLEYLNYSSVTDKNRPITNTAEISKSNE